MPPTGGMGSTSASRQITSSFVLLAARSWASRFSSRAASEFEMPLLASTRSRSSLVGAGAGWSPFSSMAPSKNALMSAAVTPASRSVSSSIELTVFENSNSSRFALPWPSRCSVCMGAARHAAAAIRGSALFDSWQPNRCTLASVGCVLISSATAAAVPSLILLSAMSKCRNFFAFSSSGSSCCITFCDSAAARTTNARSVGKQRACEKNDTNFVCAAAGSAS
mmetsp:Transcript_2692/g.6243  ORF Transcript_2692/g.6243 Transcript_2692/m.6243 type:complete len:223 (+) Transcript_2692:131-799(+)